VFAAALLAPAALPEGRLVDLAGFVLPDFTEAGVRRVQEMVSRAADAVSAMVELGVETAMNTFNGPKGLPE